jgi:hypothetical protein
VIWEGIAAELASHGFSDAIIEDVANLVPGERGRLVPSLLALGPAEVIKTNRICEVSQQRRAEFDAAMAEFKRAAGGN